MGKVVSLDAFRTKQAEKTVAAIDKAFNTINTTFCRSMLREATALVRAKFPDVKVRDAWTYHFRGDHWEFHGPDKFYWHGSASGAYDARYKGWMAWLASKGVDLDEQ